MSATTAVTYDMTAIDEPRAQRRRAVPRPGAERRPHRRGVPLPGGRALGVGDLAGDRRPRHASSPPACWRWASSPSSGSASRPAPGYEWILADLAIMCAGGATTTVYPSTHGRGRRLHPRPTPSAGWSSPRTTSRSPSSREHRSELPHLDKVVTFDGTADGDWVIGAGRPRDARRGATSPSTPASSRSASTAIRPDQLATLIYTSGTTGRPKGVRLRAHARGSTRAPRSRRRTSSTRTTCSSSGCRWRTRSARCCCRPSSPAASPPRSTAGSTRSSTTSAVVKPTFMGAAPRIFEKAHAPDRHHAGRRGRR